MPIDPLRSHLKITAHSSGLTPSSVQPSHFVEWLCCCWPKNYRACTKKCNTSISTLNFGKFVISWCKKNTAFIQYNAASTICYKSFATTGIFRHFRKYNEFQSTANSGAIYRLEYKKFHEGCAKEHL